MDKNNCFMKNLMLKICCAALLVAGLCGCEKVHLDLLTGTWTRVYPEGVVADGGTTWTFGPDNKLIIKSFDVVAGDNELQLTYYLNQEARSLTIEDPASFGQTIYAIEECYKQTLLLRRSTMSIGSGSDTEELHFTRKRD